MNALWKSIAKRVNAPRRHLAGPDARRTPLSYDPHGERKLLSAGYDPKAEHDETKKVNVHDLVAIQRHVDKAKVEEMRAKQRYKLGDPLKVGVLGGRKYLYDGHHRAAAAILDGHSMVNADLKHLDRKVEKHRAVWAVMTSGGAGL